MVLAHNQYKKYFQLTNGSIRFLVIAGRKQGGFLYVHSAEACLTGRAHQTLEPHSDRMNMTTQDPEKENL
jgi:hypothetical protein